MKTVKQSIVLMAYLVLLGLAKPAFAEAMSVSAWLDKLVVTGDGVLIGQVRDVVFDSGAQGLEAFVTVELSEYLTDDADAWLTAIPASRLQADREQTYVRADISDVSKLPRARPGSDLDLTYWQSAEESSASDSSARQDGERAVATITNGRRRGVIREGDLAATIEGSGSGAAKPVAPRRWSGARPAMASRDFERFDTDSDGYLSRSELEGRLGSAERFNTFDFDGNDGLDVFEFEVLLGR